MSEFLLSIIGWNKNKENAAAWTLKNHLEIPLSPFQNMKHSTFMEVINVFEQLEESVSNIRAKLAKSHLS